MYTVYFVARRLRRAPKQAFTAVVYHIGVVSVALGLAATLVAFLTMQGFQRNVEQKLTGLEGHLQVTQYSLNRTHEAPPLERTRLRGLQQAFLHAVRAVKVFAHKAVLLKAAEEVEGVVCKGMEVETMQESLLPYLTEGRLIAGGSHGYSHELLLSMHTAQRLQVQVGDEVLVCVMQQPPRYRKLKVVGLYTTHIADLDEKVAFCDLRLIQRLNNWPESLVGGAAVFLYDLRQTRVTAEGLLGWLDYDLGVTTIQGEYMAIFDWLLIMRQNVWVFMALILLVASSNLASIVLIQIMERTSMIGVLKALGASDGQIRRIMLGNNLYMVGCGMCWGNMVSLGLCALQSHFKLIPLDPAYYYIDYVPIAWDWGLILRLNVLVFGVVTTALLISIGLIVRLRPIKAIQFR